MTHQTTLDGNGCGMGREAYGLKLQGKGILELMDGSRVRDRGKVMVRGPYLALIAVHSNVEKPEMGLLEWAFSQVEKTYHGVSQLTFDEVIGYVGVLDKWSLFKRRPEGRGMKQNLLALSTKTMNRILASSFS